MPNSLRCLLLEAQLGCFLLLATTSWSVAEESVPVLGRAVLPLPPQQAAPWEPAETSLPEVVVDAGHVLFEQGLADPRGCEYREVEVVVGSCWGSAGVVSTHAWVLPPGEDESERFAVCWDGLVYPVVSVAERADVERDVRAYAEDPKTVTNDRLAWSPISHATPTRLKAILLLRLGEASLAEACWARCEASRLVTDSLGRDGDPYLSLAGDWAWSLFDRAVCAHMRSDDCLSLVSARKLAEIRPRIERTANERGFKRPQNRGYRISPYHLGFLEPLDRLLADQERRAKRDAPPADAADASVAEMIQQLEEIDARQWSQPGGVTLSTDERVVALAQAGEEVVEPLIACLENDNRLTRSVSFFRSFHRSRDLIGVSDAAYTALVQKLGIRFLPHYGVPHLPEDRRKAAAQIRAYWARVRGLSAEERWYETLRLDDASPRQWAESASWIVAPADYDLVRYDFDADEVWRRLKKPASAPWDLRGEGLRTLADPSVSELLSRRAHEATDLDASCDLAVLLTAWDPAAASGPLREQRDRLRAALEKPHPKKRFIPRLGRLTLLLARCGDDRALADYADWLRSLDARQFDHGGWSDMFAPFAEFGDSDELKNVDEWLLRGDGSAWDPTPLVGTASSTESDKIGSFAWLLSKSSSLRRQVTRVLHDETVIGVVRRTKRDRAEMETDHFTSGYSLDADDPRLIAVGSEHPLQRQDEFAHRLSRVFSRETHKAHWTESARAAGRAQLLERVQELGSAD